MTFSMPQHEVAPGRLGTRQVFNSVRMGSNHVPAIGLGTPFPIDKRKLVSLPRYCGMLISKVPPVEGGTSYPTSWV